MGLPFGMAKIVMAGSGRQDEGVVVQVTMA